MSSCQTTSGAVRHGHTTWACFAVSLEGTPAASGRARDRRCSVGAMDGRVVGVCCVLCAAAACGARTVGDTVHTSIQACCGMQQCSMRQPGSSSICQHRVTAACGVWKWEKKGEGIMGVHGYEHETGSTCKRHTFARRHILYRLTTVQPATVRKRRHPDIRDTATTAASHPRRGRVPARHGCDPHGRIWRI